MLNQIDINCIGMKCPRPIIEIAKAARKSASGSIINILADDLAFESDVNAWAENTGATILSISKEDGQISVKIQIQ
ncbi:MAG: sulfurtransferase TusA family protein [Saprospiraceae bacterium]|nr:sulfurtransferase TusA family protein [Saprospiraceae bacterium]